MSTFLFASRPRRRIACASLALCAALVLLLTRVLLAAPTGAAAQGAGDWPTYLNSALRQGFNGAETTITATSAPHLKLHWSQSSAGVISTQPTTENGIVYWGSWDGLEHAANVTTGATIWTQNLGTTTDLSCSPSTVGVASTGTIATVTLSGVPTLVLFVGGGDGNFYALNAATGAILWKTSLGAPPTYFLWSSPAFSGGNIYEGISSFGDCPNVAGKLFMLSAVTGVVSHTFVTVPAGCNGGGVWGSPAIDAAAGLLFIATGNAGGCSTSEPFASAFVKLAAGSLREESSWQVPHAQQISDSDFGTTPDLFTATISGVATQMIGAPNKNGTFYALDRSHLSHGPLWQVQVATKGGTCPQCGNGSIAPAAFDGTTLYIAGGTVMLGSTSCKGSVWAVNPATGAALWRHCMGDGAVIGAVSAVPGVIVATEGPDIVFLSAATGATLLAYLDSGSGSTFWAASSISNGQVFTGNKDGHFTVLGT